MAKVQINIRAVGILELNLEHIIGKLLNHGMILMVMDYVMMENLLHSFTEAAGRPVDRLGEEA